MGSAPSPSPSGGLAVPAGPPPAAARPARALVPQFGGIWGFVLRRVLLGLLVLAIVSVVVFAATQALGDPARAILGRQATPESLKALREQLHLDRSVFSQYWTLADGPPARRRGHVVRRPGAGQLADRRAHRQLGLPRLPLRHHLDPARDRDRRLRGASPRQALRQRDLAHHAALRRHARVRDRPLARRDLRDDGLPGRAARDLD